MNAHAHHHHHHHPHEHKKHSRSKSNLGIAFLLNVGFTIIEGIGGWLTGSIAILSDALHDLGDSLALGLAYFLQTHSEKTSSAKFSYGYRRLSLFSAGFTATVLIAGSIAIFWHAIPRLFEPVQPVTEGMLALSILGLAVNGYAAYKVVNGRTLGERMISWHLIEDVLGWVAVLLSSIIMMFWNIPILDPILSIVFTIFILIGVFKNFKLTLGLFMQGVPQNVDVKALRESFLNLHGVKDVHDLHYWSLDGEHHVLTAHVVVDSHLTLVDAEKIKSQIKKLAANSEGRIHATIEIEADKTNCPDVDCVKN